jgi:hypothetical protein
MNRYKRCLFAVICMLLLSALVLACGDDDNGGGSVSAEAACSHYCSCSFASAIPNCQSTCVTGINMAKDSAACASCTNNSSCSELQNNSCESACQP